MLFNMPRVLPPVITTLVAAGLHGPTPLGRGQPTVTPSVTPPVVCDSLESADTTPERARSSVASPGTLQDIPGMLTVIPFELTDDGMILLPAVIDGRHGEFLFDLGSPLCILNGKYVQLAPDSSLDTAATGAPASQFTTAFQGVVGEAFGIKDFTTRMVPAYIRTLQLGTLTMSFDRTHRYGVVHTPFAGMVAENTRAIIEHGHPMLGTIGLSALGHVETIIDYPKHQLIMIRLDSAGHRLVPVPAYTPRTTVPLIPVADHALIGVEGTVAGTTRPWLLDTGSSDDEVDAMTVAQFGPHAVVVGHDADTGRDTNTGTDTTPVVHLDSLRLGGILYAARAFRIGEDNTLGYPFLRAQGVVGINLRTRQFIVYR